MTCSAVRRPSAEVGAGETSGPPTVLGRRVVLAAGAAGAAAPGRRAGRRLGISLGYAADRSRASFWRKVMRSAWRRRAGSRWRSSAAAETEPLSELDSGSSGVNPFAQSFRTLARLVPVAVTNAARRSSSEDAPPWCWRNVAVAAASHHERRRQRREHVAEASEHRLGFADVAERRGEVRVPPRCMIFRGSSPRTAIHVMPVALAS